MKIFTIGFTKKSASAFFTALQDAGVKRIVDVRLNNVSQLAAFTKKDDLRYFAKAICGIEYVHVPSLAPTKEMLDQYKKRDGDWSQYESKFLDLIQMRQVEVTTPAEVLDWGCLLCSEEKPHNCHRRLVAEYFRGKWGNVEIEHIP